MGSTSGTRKYRYLFEIQISVLLDEYSEVELLEHMVVLFLIFMKSLHTLPHSGHTILHSHQEHTVIVCLHPCQHLLLSFCLIKVILIGVR